MEISEATALFGLEGKFSYRELKLRFRKLSLTMHPDVGGDEADFIRLMDSFKILESLASIDPNGSSSILSTVEGIPLSELGKGFSLTVSAKACESCEGRGYKIYSGGTVEAECPSCKGDGKFGLPCKKCSGSGRYMHPKTGKDVGECFSCGGTGRFYPKYKPQGRSKWKSPLEFYYNFYSDLRAKYIELKDGTRVRVNACRTCDGDGVVRVPNSDNKLYRKCDACEGIGEVKMWNPVLPRGLLANKE